jgi:uncharacterized protein YciI
MLWAIFCVDRPNTAAIRETHMQPHRGYLNSKQDILVLGGATLTDNGSEVKRCARTATRAPGQAEFAACATRDRSPLRARRSGRNPAQAGDQPARIFGTRLPSGAPDRAHHRRSRSQRTHGEHACRRGDPVSKARSGVEIGTRTFFWSRLMPRIPRPSLQGCPTILPSAVTAAKMFSSAVGIAQSTWAGWRTIVRD